MKLDANGNPVVDDANKGPEAGDDKSSVKVEPKVDPTKVEPKAFVVDTTLSQAEQTASVLKEAGLDAAAVAEAGKLTLADTIALQAKFGDAVVTAITTELATGEQTRAAAQTKEDENLYGMCAAAMEGSTEQTGEQVFNDVSAWAKETLTEAELKDANALLEQGGLAAQLVMQDLLSTYTQTDGAQAPVALTPVTPAANTADSSPITRTQYGIELDKLMAAGHAYESAAVKKLQARRTQGAAQGI